MTAFGVRQVAAIHRCCDSPRQPGDWKVTGDQELPAAYPCDRGSGWPAIGLEIKRPLGATAPDPPGTLSPERSQQVVGGPSHLTMSRGRRVLCLTPELSGTHRSQPAKAPSGARRLFSAGGAGAGSGGAVLEAQLESRDRHAVRAAAGAQDAEALNIPP
ncbi:uncharacterized protein LOC103739294 isoform X3 [Nannospalax galili]|uniref:uncharacterized protein LOC103739294 isoform X3 n=1 Tax=Nannospalax galili TaxID=1026970 RepID=UPI00081A1C6B|nr:uncharacterized protein LOC103739294 isoform X3 [Nannospalax galili]